MTENRPGPRMFFDRQGEPITIERWSELFEDRDYKKVATTTVGRFVVSTAWLGLDHGFPFLGDPRLIFETMVFDRGPDVHGLDRFHDLEMRRYSTEAAARQGHAEMVQLVTELEAVDE